MTSLGNNQLNSGCKSSPKTTGFDLIREKEWDSKIISD